MIRKLLLLLVVITILQNTSYSQQGEVLVQTFYSNAGGGGCNPNSIVIRIALRNNTGTTVALAGIRYGIQYNAAAVTLTGITSYMHNGSPGNGLNDLAFINNLLGPDSGPTGTDDGTRTAQITTGGSKIMTKRYFNRSTDNCANVWFLTPRTFRIALDICFQLVPPKLLSDYGLQASPYGFGTSQYITQILSSLDADLSNSNKEIGIYLHTGGGGNNNLYQPFDISNCNNQNYNPFTLDEAIIISPINGVLSGKILKLDAEERNDHVALDWEVEHNELVDHYEIERKDENGNFKTIGLVMSDNKNSTTLYQFKDKITSRDQKLYYKVKTVGVDQVITYSDIRMVRPGSAQQHAVKIFPNPTSDVIRFKAPLINGNYVCRVYSNEGRMVLTANASPLNSSINIKSLVTGSYFVELYHPQSGKRFYSQFSKQ